ncbi:MAG: VOC family protein [Candidatus Saccharimonadales bacterium]
MPKISPFLWFDTQAEQAAEFYVSVFPNSKIGNLSRYDKEGYEVHKMPDGTVMSIEFELDGQKFVALNGGPIFKFNESVSFVIPCGTQKDIDYYWDKLSAVPESEQCGWLKDKYGLSWQVVPTMIGEIMSNPDPEKAGRITNAMLKMKKLDIEKLKNA